MSQLPQLPYLAVIVKLDQPHRVGRSMDRSGRARGGDKAVAAGHPTVGQHLVDGVLDREPTVAVLLDQHCVDPPEDAGPPHRCEAVGHRGHRYPWAMRRDQRHTDPGRRGHQQPLHVGLLRQGNRGVGQGPGGLEPRGGRVRVELGVGEGNVDVLGHFGHGLHRLQREVARRRLARKHDGMGA